jgi:type I restriction enzyme S subunit
VTEWQTTSLGSVATLQRGFDMPTRLRKRGTIPIVSSSGVSGRHDRAMVKAPGVVTGRYGTIGEVFYQDRDFWPLNTTLWVSNFHGNDERFIYYLLQRVDFETHSGKSGVPGVNRNDLHMEVVNVPRSKDEQRAIAEALSDVDDLVAGVERKIAKKQAIKQGVVQQLLTGRTRMPGFTEPWSEASIFKLANNQRALFNDGDWIESEHITTAGNRLLQTGNIGVGRLLDRGTRRYISDESFSALKCKEVVPGDILICRLAEPAGRACVVTDIGERRLLTSVDVTVYRPDPGMADRRFLVAAFSTPGWFQDVSERCGGSTRTRIARSELGRIRICLPGLEEQSRIADFLSDVDRELRALEARLAKARTIKLGMMQQLLTGRVRLAAEAAS